MAIEERAHERLPALAVVLAHVSGQLAASLDYGETLRRISTLAVPALADYCFFDIPLPAGGFRRIAWAHADPQLEEEFAAEMGERFPGKRRAAAILRALASGEVIVENDLDENWQERTAVTETHLRVLRCLAPRSVMYIPLVATTGAIGVLTLAMSISGRTYGQDDIGVAQELATQAVHALEHARLFGELEAQKRLLEAQGEAAADGILVVGPDGKILSANRKFRELWGIPEDVVATASDDAALDVALNRVRDPEAFLERVRRIYADPNYSGNDVIEFTDGRILDRFTSPVFDAEARLIGRLWSFRDVTEQRRTEQALRYQIDLTTSIVENAQAGLLLVDERGHATYVNEAWTAMTGYTLEDMRGRPAHDLVHHHRPDGAPFPIAECPIDRALPERRIVLPYDDMFIHKDGTVFPVRAAASPILRDGVPVGTIAEVQDISEERSTEAALRAATAADLDRAAKLDALIGAIRDAVVVVEPDGSVSLANPAAHELFGRPIGSVEALIDAFEDPSPMTRRVADGAAATNVGRLRRDAGWIEVRTYETTDRGDGARARIYLFRDVSDERKAAALRDRFLEVLSHELRTPVTTIYGGSRLLARNAIGEGPAHELLSDIVTEADRLYRLIENLVVLTKTREGALDVSSEPVLLGHIVQNVVVSERRRWPQVRFSLQLDPTAPPVEADGTSVEQVVRNLLGNAAKYGHGKVDVRVEAVAGREVAVHVRDDGPGIAEDALSRVFELFYRTPDAVRRASGAGIGLFVSRHLVEAMNGRIWAQNVAGDGAEFSFSLPAVVDES